MPKSFAMMSQVIYWNGSNLHSTPLPKFVQVAWFGLGEKAVVQGVVQGCWV